MTPSQGSTNDKYNYRRNGQNGNFAREGGRGGVEIASIKYDTRDILVVFCLNARISNFRRLPTQVSLEILLLFVKLFYNKQYNHVPTVQSNT